MSETAERYGIAEWFGVPFLSLEPGERTDGTLTQRGHKWRVDSSVGEACQEILDEVYPNELMGLSDNGGNPDRRKVSEWFQQKGYDKSNANRMAVTYVTVASKSSPEPQEWYRGAVSKPRKTQPKENPESAGPPSCLLSEETAVACQPRAIEKRRERAARSHVPLPGRGQRVEEPEGTRPHRRLASPGSDDAGDS